MTERKLCALWQLLAGKPTSPRNYRLTQEMHPEEAYRASFAQLAAVLGEKDAAYFENKDRTEAEKIAADCEARGIRICSYYDPEYPPALREIPDPPPVLFYLGELPDPDLPSVAIVGTRRCSNEGAQITASFACSLALSGIQIISGMADGIDAYAHKGALLKQMPNFAVLGCGVDVIFPKKNEEIYRELIRHGGILSEYLPGTPPLRENFPRRNRIISGLSDGILVTECPRKSGAMITAKFAAEQNRTLFAVPASARETVNDGTNELIRQGAVFTASPEDIYREFAPRFADQITPVTVRIRLKSTDYAPIRQNGPVSVPKQREERNTPPEPKPIPSDLPENERLVYGFLTDEGISADAICSATGLPFYQLLPILQTLEIAGYAQALPGALYRKL